MTIEEYWEDCQNRLGFIKSKRNGKIIYSLPERLGSGGFEIWGDANTAMALVSELRLHKPMVFYENCNEKYLELGHFYSGNAAFYQKKSEIHLFEHGLNYYVNNSSTHGYKRVEPHVPFLSVGLFYRDSFFDSLKYQLPDDFWNVAPRILNPVKLNIPAISQILLQIKNCSLTDHNLKMFIQGKALEALAITVDFVYSNISKAPVHLSAYDIEKLHQVRDYLENNYIDHPTISILSEKFNLNKQKLTEGFKLLFNTTIYAYIQAIKVHKAIFFLENTEMLIVEVAKAVGYHGDGHFQRVFKEHYGVTPSKFKKELRA